MIRLRAWACAVIPGMHPGLDLLVMRAEGSRWWSVETHVARCARCRENANRIHAAEPAGGLAADRTFEHLQLRMRAWRSLAGLTHSAESQAREGDSSGTRLAQAIEVYFGREAARRIQRVTRGNERPPVIPAAKPLFAAFLGRRAADALARKIGGAAL